MTGVSWAVVPLTKLPKTLQDRVVNAQSGVDRFRLVGDNKQDRANCNSQTSDQYNRNQRGYGLSSVWMTGDKVLKRFDETGNVAQRRQRAENGDRKNLSKYCTSMITHPNERKRPDTQIHDPSPDKLGSVDALSQSGPEQISPVWRWHCMTGQRSLWVAVKNFERQSRSARISKCDKGRR